MKVLVGIATYQRPEKLKRLLRSLEIQSHTDFYTHVVFDNGDVASMSAVKECTLPLSMELLSGQNYVIGCWNSAHRLKGFDAHLMLCDDVELFPDCIEAAVKDMQNHFPDLSGVVGLTQFCPGREDYTYKPFGQTLMGRGFIDKFRKVNYKVCCPDFIHFFQDQCMWEYMSGLGRTFHSSTAKLNHYHPSFKAEELDSTHKIVRAGSGIFQKDAETYRRRQEEGMIWGRDFRLLSDL
jgi:hypothetical protein